LKIDIELTEKQEHFLKLFAKNQHPGAKDNVCTNKPIHAVQTKRFTIVDNDYDYEDVAYFYTLQSAKEYIKYQSRNLTNPRTYTKSGGYSNYGEYEHFWDLLMSLGIKLNKNQED